MDMKCEFNQHKKDILGVMHLFNEEVVSWDISGFYTWSLINGINTRDFMFTFDLIGDLIGLKYVSKMQQLVCWGLKGVLVYGLDNESVVINHKIDHERESGIEIIEREHSSSSISNLFYFVSWSQKRNEIFIIDGKHVFSISAHTGSDGILGMHQLNDKKYGKCILSYSNHQIILFSTLDVIPWETNKTIVWNLPFQYDLLSVRVVKPIINKKSNNIESLAIGFDGGPVALFKSIVPRCVKCEKV